MAWPGLYQLIDAKRTKVYTGACTMLCTFSKRLSKRKGIEYWAFNYTRL